MAKSTKAVAHYQDKPKGSACCRVCDMYRPPHDCTSVQGEVQSNGWCRYFERKSDLVKALTGR